LKTITRHVILTTPTWGQFVITRLILLWPTRAQKLGILSSAIPEKFKGCKILKWITWPCHALFRDGQSSEG